MHGRRIYHARGKVLGGSSSINGMIFQRGNPLDYERWAADPGMRPGTTRTACPTSSGWRTASRPTPATRSAGTTARSCSSAVRPPTRSSRPSSGPASRPATPAPTTSTATGRRASPPSTATSTSGRRLSAARAYLHPVMNRPNLEVETRALVSPDPLRGQAGGRRRVPARPRARHGRSRAGEVILCGGAINSPQLLQLSGVGNAAELEPLGIDVVHRPARGRREPPGPPRGLHPVRLQAAGLDAAVPQVAAPAADRCRVAVPAQGPRRHQPLRGRRLRALQRGRGLPQPDVPLPADRGPVRRLVARRRRTATRCTSGRCTPTPAAGSRSAARTRASTRSLRFNYLSTDQDRREWVESIRVARHILNQPAFEPFNDGEVSPGPEVETDEQILDWVAPRRRDRAAPLLHAARWASTRCPWSTR